MLDDIKKTTRTTADEPCANKGGADYKHMALGLIFLKYLSDSFQMRQNFTSSRRS